MTTLTLPTVDDFRDAPFINAGISRDVYGPVAGYVIKEGDASVNECEYHNAVDLRRTLAGLDVRVPDTHLLPCGRLLMQFVNGLHPSDHDEFDCDCLALGLPTCFRNYANEIAEAADLYDVHEMNVIISQGQLWIIDLGG